MGDTGPLRPPDEWAYGVSRYRNSLAGADALYDNVNLVSHEMGHNFGGLHERSLGVYGLTAAASLPPPYTIMNPTAVEGLLQFSELQGVVNPLTGFELDNAHPMRALAEARLAPAGSEP